MTRHAKLINDGDGQQVQLPADYAFDGAEVGIERDTATGKVTLTPLAKDKSWEQFFRIVDEMNLPADFMSDRDLGVHQRENIF